MPRFAPRSPYAASADRSPTSRAFPDRRPASGLPLRERALRLPRGDQLLRKRATGRAWEVSEEADNRRHEPEGGGRVVVLPVGDRERGGAELVGNVALAEAEIKPPLAQVISNSDKRLRVELGARSSGPSGGDGKATRGCGAAAARSMKEA
jgi:hypothetical protein